MIATGRWLGPLADLVFPAVCVGCGAPGSAFCERCVAASGRRVTLPGLLPVTAHGWYDGALRAALVRYKERGRRDLAEPLAALLGTAVFRLGDHAPLGPIALVPVPSAPARARQRGGDHVLRLARIVGRVLDRPVCAALRLDRPVEDSAHLAAAQRVANLHGAMRSTGPDSGVSHAIVVDDIVTTGTTVAEAARALRRAGWTIAGAAVVAATPLRYGVSSPGG